MELRHFRYFVAVAEAGSLTVAAARRLHTSQPSLSRQIRDLEDEVGAQLLTRGARGIELTPAGRTFLDHARLVLSQVEAAAEAARRGGKMAEPSSTTVEKKCSRCGERFLCRQETGCWCASVRVEPAMLAELRARYADCLCEVCLREFAATQK